MYDYLGMQLDYCTKGKVRITMSKHIKIILELTSEEMDGMAETPEASHIFTVR